MLLLKSRPEQVNGRFLGQVNGAGLLVDVPDALGAVALQILGVLHRTSRTGKRERERQRGGITEEEGKEHIKLELSFHIPALVNFH